MKRTFIAHLGDLAASINRGEPYQDLQKRMPGTLSRIPEEDYFIYLTGAAYQMCGEFEKAKKYAKKLGKTCPDLGASGLEQILFSLLKGNKIFVGDSIRREAYRSGSPREILFADVLTVASTRSA